MMPPIPTRTKSSLFLVFGFLFFANWSTLEAQSCECTEYVYLNDTEARVVHKFRVEADGSLTELFIGGMPWISTGFPSPHGVGTDLNGNVYIGERAPGDVRKISCDGEVLPEAEFVILDGGNNFGTIDNFLLMNDRDMDENIQFYDLCTGELVGVICHENFSDSWGLHVDPRTKEIYYTSNRAPRGVYKSSIADLNTGVCVSPLIVEGIGVPNIGDSFLPDDNSPYGITTDVDGNIYIVMTPSFPRPEAQIYKYSPTGVLLAVSIYDTDDRDGSIARWSNGISLVYSETNNLIYTSNGTNSASEDCVSIFDTDLNYLGTAFPNPPAGVGQQAKGIGITKECCPTVDDLVVDQVICDTNVGDVLFLGELINCDGSVCEGVWREIATNLGLTYDPCDNSIVIDLPDACGTFLLESDGIGNNPACGAFVITVNISVQNVTEPVIAAGPVPNCENDNDPGEITVVTPSTGTSDVSYQWQSSTTSCSDGFVDIPGAPFDGSGFDPDIITEETYFRLIAEVNGPCNDGSCADTSNCIVITPEGPCGSFDIDLELSKDVDIWEPAVGDILKYSIQLTNQSENGASNVSVTDSLPDAAALGPLTLLPPVVSGPQSANYTAVIDQSLGGPGILYSIDTLAPGDTITFCYNAQVLADQKIKNYAYVSGSDQIDNDSCCCEDDRDCVAVKSGAPIIEIDKLADRFSVLEGEQYQFQIFVENNGSVPDSNIVVTDAVPENCGTVLESDATDGEYAAGIWTIPDLQPGEVAILNIIVEAGAVGLCNNVASVTGSDYLDLNPDDIPPPAEEDVVIEPAPVLDPMVDIDKIGDRANALPGEQVQFQIIVQNNGLGIDSNLVIEDVVPPCMTIVDFDAQDGVATEAGGTITWEIEELVPGEIEILNVIVEIASESGVCVNTATLAGSDFYNENPDLLPDPAQDSVEVVFDASIGLAKRASHVELKDDGCTEITYEFNVENLGNVPLDSIVLTDDLSTAFAACGSFNVRKITSDDFVVNPAYAGAAGESMLGVGVDLPAGDKGAVLVKVEACGCPDVDIENTANVMGEDPNGDTVMDTSDSGAEPDTDGDGIADEAGENDPTITPVGSNPVIGLAKRASHVELLGNGCTEVTYEFNIENLGNVTLDSIMLTDDLDAAFGACGSFDIHEITSDDFVVNPAYDGTVGINMLGVGIDLPVGDKGAVLVTVEACGCPDADIENSATIEGTAPNGDMPTDISDSGSEPDPDGDGTPDGPDEDDPTITTISSNPAIGLAKRASHVELLDNGCTEVTYEFNVENLGNVDLDNIMLTDNLEMAFGRCGSFDIHEITSDDFVVNPAYDGAAGVSMLAMGVDLPTGDKGAVLVTVQACGCPDTDIINSATVQGAAPNGMLPMDTSDSGAEPDADGDGVADEDGENDPTITPVGSNPVIGLAKRAAKVWLQDDGCALVEYEFNIENLGNVVLDDLVLTDNISGAFGACTSADIKEITSDDFVVNPAYNGAAGINLLGANQDIPVGDKGAVLVLVEACGCPNSDIENTAMIMGTAPNGDTPTDVSDSGSEPDPDGDGTPDGPEEDDPTITTISSNPVIGLAKRATKVELLDNGCSEVTYEFNVENLGNVILDDIVLTDDLGMAFGACGTFAISEITSDDFVVNPAYNGAGGVSMLGAGVDLPAGDKGAVLVTVEACGCPNADIENTAMVVGTAPNGEMPEDISDSGSEPDPDGDGTSDGPDEDDPTITTIGSDPVIGLAKRAAKVWLQDDGCTLVEYEFNIENLGNVVLDDLVLTDDIVGAFGACTSADIKEITSDDFVVNPAYNGAAGTNLLGANQDIPVGDKGAVLVLVEACGCPDSDIENTAMIVGTAPNGEMPEDISDSGSEPDPDGDGTPDGPDEDDPTITTISSNPVIGLAKRATRVELLDNGCSEVTYEFNVENLGNVILDDLVLTDDLNTAFTACGSFAISEITSDDFVVNPAYDGAAGVSMLGAGVDLPAGDKGAVLVTVEACGCPDADIENSAMVVGTAPNGEMPEDISDSGSEPDPDGDGTSDGPNEDDPTITTISSNPVIGLAKRATRVELLDNGCSEVTYEFNVENLGNVILDDLVLTDDLNTAFTACGSFVISEITSDDFVVNPAYDGAAGVSMLGAGVDLPAGDKGAVLVTVEACGCPDSDIENSAMVVGTAPNGEMPEDISDSGSEPDPDGDGTPDGPDEDDPTITSLMTDPAIGVAKRVVDLQVKPDGSADIIYEFNIENYGNVDLDNIQLTDDLADVFSPCLVTILTITSDDFKVNDAYNGATDLNLLLGNDDLPVGDKGAILLSINVSNCGDTSGPFMNTATVSATAPDGEELEDDSQSGSDPDPDGNGDPTDNDETTDVNFEFENRLGLAKNVVAIVPNANGSVDVTYEFNLQNFGNQIVEDVQVMDNLATVYDPCDVTVLSLTSDDFTVNNLAPGNFDGVTVFDLLEGTDDIGVGDEGAILLTINVDNCGGLTGPFNNTAFITGTSADGTPLDDISQNGTEPDPDGDGNPNNNNDPTPVNFGFDPGIGIAKRVSRLSLNDNGCFDLVYEIRVENTGDVDLANIQVTEDLATTFANAESFTVTGVESEEFTVNTAFDGLSPGTNVLLNGTDTLTAIPGGDEGAIYIFINVCPGNDPGPYLNTAVVNGTTPSGDILTDESTDGSDPDPNSDGIPDENEPTPVVLEFDPSIGLAKRLASIEMITDDCARVTYEFNIENFGNTIIDNVQLTDDINAAFAGCSGDVSIFSITSDDYTVNDDYDDALATGMLLTGNNSLQVSDVGSVLLTVDACTCGTSVVTNSATVTGVDPAGDPVEDVSTDGSDPDPNGDGTPDEDEPTVHTITCTVAIICPDVHDPVNVQNDLEECGALVNFPDAKIESNCTDIDAMDIQYMLTATSGDLPVTDPANGDAIVPYNVWITGQAGGLMYPVDTVLVTYRINPADLPQGPTAPLLTPGECSFTVIVRDEQCPVFVTTMPEDTIIYDCIIPQPFVVNPVWHLRDNCTDPADVAVDFVETQFDSICPNTYTLKRTWTITDEAGNACEHNHKLFVRDTTPPMIMLPPDTIIQECAVGEVILNCREIYTPIDTVQTQVLVGGDWVITNVVTKDTSVVCDTIITPVPLTAGMPEVNDGACTDAEDILVTFRDSVDLVCKGDKAAIVHRIWRAEDECGNVREAIQEITIIDPNPPVLVVKPEVTISLGPDGHVNLTRDDVILNLFDACFTDASDIELLIEPGYFNCSDLGEHRVIVAATDPCNNKTAYEEVIVTIVDTVAPVLNCPAGTVNVDINPMDCDASFGGVVDILAGVDCNVEISTLPKLDAGIDITTTSILVTAVDASGNTSTCNVSVSVSLTEQIDFETALACNDRLNVSLGGECWLELTPDMILEGDLQICSNLLCIEVEDESGSDHLNFFDETDVNQLFKVKVVDCNGSGNSCWAEVLIEEKQIPIVSFPVDTMILCVEPTDPEYHKLGFPIIENCELDVDIDYEDVYREFEECSDPRATIERRWFVQDDEGNVLRDTQIISILPFSNEHLVFPEDLSFYNDNVVNCLDVSETEEEIETGMIDPTSKIHPDSTGKPNIFGIDLFDNNGLCLFSMDYKDEVLDLCGGSYEILRTWSVRDACNSINVENNLVRHTQVITVYDVNGPQVLDERVAVTVSSSPWTCAFAGYLPQPDSIVESCGIFEFDAYVTGPGAGYIELEGSYETGDLQIVGIGIEEGTHWVTYVYKDGCSNIELFKYQLEVIDEVAPVAVCNSSIQVVVTSNDEDGAVAKIYAESIDGGSQDAGCGPIKERCIIKRVDFDAGEIGTIGGELAYRAVNGCFQDGELIDTTFDKNGAVDSIARIPFVICSDVVKFCCTDLGLQDVVLVVKDDAGNKSHCWTTVDVGDKSNARLDCQPHTIDCTDDRDSKFLKPIGYNDFCGDDVPLAYIDDSDFLDGCGEGQIFRIWYLDANGNDTIDEGEASCNQVVTVTNSTVFDPYTIKWPKHYTGEVFDGVNLECDADTVLQEIETTVAMGDVFTCTADVGGDPVWCNTACGLIGVSSEVDTVNASDACLKLVKRWTIIDWCYWEANGSDVDDENDGAGDQFQAVEDWAQGLCDGCVDNVSDDPVYFRYTEVDLDGYYTYDQVIKVVDDTAPSISVEDILVNTVGGATSKDDDTACTGSETITAVATDLCGDVEVPAELISWTIEYDNGVQSSTTTARGGSATIETQAGVPGDEHTVSFTARDGCGNSTTETISVTFRDEKAPVPLCISGITTAFMESTGKVAIWAKDFDLGSFDNCSDLSFSIVNSGETPASPDSSAFADQGSIEFDCTDLSNFYELDVWVWDISGNGDFCTVGVLIGGTCDGSEPGNGAGAMISGSIYTENDDMVENTSVRLAANELAEYPKSALTGSDGQYAFASNPLGFAYTVTPRRNDDHINGVSTLDILLIQRHILDLNKLDSPYKLIASDVNNDQNTSAADILELRRLILGLTNTFSSNESWRFVNKSSNFFELSSPWPFVEILYHEELQTDMLQQDFIAVKVGDVNADAAANGFMKSETRSGTKAFSIRDESFAAGEEVTVAIYAKDISSFEGVQFTMRHEGLRFEELISGAIDVSPEQLGVHTSALTMSWESMTAITQTDEALFELRFTSTETGRTADAIKMNSSITSSEIYSGEEVSTLVLAVDQDRSELTSAMLMQNDPNPFSMVTKISFALPSAAEASVIIYDVTGTEMKRYAGQYGKGLHTIELAENELESSGLYYYQLTVDGQFIDSKKMMVIK